MLNIDDKLKTYALGIVVSPGDSAELLIKSLVSLHLQSQKPDEIVLLKNGILSPLQDKIVEDFVSKSRVAVIVLSYEKTVNLGNALNICIENIKSDYFIRHDPDDLSMKDRVKKIKAFNLTGDFDIIYSSFVELNRKKDTFRLQGLKISESGILDSIFLRNTIGHSTVAVKKSKIQSVGGYKDIFLAEDYHLWLRLLKNNACFGFIDEPLVIFDSTNVAQKRSSWKLFKSEILLLILKLRVRPGFFYKSILGFFLRLIFLLSPKNIKQIYYNRKGFNVNFNPADCLALESICSELNVDDFKRRIKLSVIIPHYNRIDSLLVAIDSIKNQSLDLDYEIIVVDDFSDSQCIEKLDKLEVENLIIIKSDSNSGACAKPRNLGINASSGEIVAFLDSDDEWKVDHLRLSLDWVINGNPCANAHIASFYPKFVTNRFLLIRNVLLTSSVIIPRNLIRESDFFPFYSDNSIYEDYVAWLKVSFFKNFLIPSGDTIIYNNYSVDSLRKKYKKEFLCVKKSFLFYMSWLSARDQKASPLIKVIMALRLASIFVINLCRKPSKN